MKIRVNTQTYDLYSYTELGHLPTGELRVQIRFETKSDDVSTMIELFGHLDGTIEVLTEGTFELIQKYTGLTHAEQYTYENGILSVILREAGLEERVTALEEAVNQIKEMMK